MYMVSSSENLKKFMTAEIGGIPHKDLLNQLTNELFTYKVHIDKKFKWNLYFFKFSRLIVSGMRVIGWCRQQPFLVVLPCHYLLHRKSVI